jgi:WNK lysine deficient protein kinase
MCILEMATQEYPYAECTNPAQIFRKVTNGVPPAAVDKVTFPALKEFILLTIQPNPSKRPEARQLLVHPFFEDVRQQIRSKGCLRMPPAAANAAAAAAVALAAAGMPAGEALVLDAAVVVGAGAAAGCLPAARTPQSVPSGLEQLAKDAAAAEAAIGVYSGDGDSGAAGSHEQQNALTWSPSQSHQVAAAAAVMAAMAAAGQQQQRQSPLLDNANSSGFASVLSTPMHSIGPESSLASNSSWGSFQQQLQAAGRARRRSSEARRSMEGRKSTDEMSEEDVLFDAQVRAGAEGRHHGRTRSKPQ